MGIFLDVLSFCVWDDFFPFFKQFGFWGFLGPRGELHCVVSHKSVWLFPLCQGHQKPVNDTRDMSGIPHSCSGCFSQVYSLWTVKFMLSKAKFWLKKVDSQLPKLQDLTVGNQETRQLELWNLAQWDILLIVPGKVLWRKCIGGLGAKINRAPMWNHCISPSPLRCFEWKYCAVSEKVFSLSVIYLHFSHCKFSLFYWIYWVRFKARLAKSPILELAA